MPESSGRKKASGGEPPVQAGARANSPRWWAPAMVSLLVVGLVWIVVFYITQQRFPVPGLGLGNLGIGFGIAMVGFAMTTRWH